MSERKVLNVSTRNRIPFPVYFCHFVRYAYASAFFSHNPAVYGRGFAAAARGLAAAGTPGAGFIKGS